MTRNSPPILSLQRQWAPPLLRRCVIARARALMCVPGLARRARAAEQGQRRRGRRQARRAAPPERRVHRGAWQHRAHAQRGRARAAQCVRVGACLQERIGGGIEATHAASAGGEPCVRAVGCTGRSFRTQFLTRGGQSTHAATSERCLSSMSHVAHMAFCCDALPTSRVAHVSRGGGGGWARDCPRPSSTAERDARHTRAQLYR